MAFAFMSFFSINTVDKKVLKVSDFITDIMIEGYQCLFGLVSLNLWHVSGDEMSEYCRIVKFLS